MKRRWPAMLVGVLIALAAALVVAPARWLITALPASWPVAVIDASGSIWRGTALLALGPAEARTTLPTPVSWQVRWNAGPRVEVSHLWLDGLLALRPQLNGVAVSARTLRLPASTLVQLGAPFNTLKPGGELSLTWPALRLSGALPVGELMTIQWRDASTVLSMLRPLGHYNVRLVGEAGNSVAVNLSSVSGPLLAEGTGRWTERGGLSFKGVARPAPNSTNEVRAALQSTLSALGRRSGDDSLLQVGR